MTSRHVYLLAVLLAAAGASLFLYKSVALEFPLAPDRLPRNWEVEAQVSFVPAGGPVVVRLAVPRNNRFHLIIDQSFVSRGYGLTTEDTDDGPVARLSARRPKGLQTVYYRFLVHRRDAPARSLGGPPQRREPPNWKGRKREAALAILEAARAKSADPPSLAREIVARLARTPPDDAAKALLGKQPTTKQAAEVAAGILALADLAARPVHGIELTAPTRRARTVDWIEVGHEGRWLGVTLDPTLTRVPDTWLAWWRGTRNVAQVDGGRDVRTRIALALADAQSVTDALSVGRGANRNLLTAPLFSLPVGTQQVYRVLLVVPLGVLLLVVLRNVVGLRNFGTFMPVLIALAFRETQLLWGIALFTIVVFCGLAVRLYMEQLRLLVVPRLAAVLIVVVAIMAALSVLSGKLGIERGLSVALFPMVILTMTVERMSVIWDERGPREALSLGAGSLMAAILCYLVMSNPLVEHLFFVFPELLLIVLAAVLALGRYSGYRLTELVRFRQLGGGGGG